MISTLTTFDSQSVREFMNDRGLDPVPTADPKQIAHRGIRLTIEPYSWGRVFFAEDRKHSSGLTWIERDGYKVDLPGWVIEIRARVDRPSCLGQHENDYVCDGGENPITGDGERPCRWRKVCLEVQKLGKTEEGIAKVLKQYDDDELWAKVETTQQRIKGSRDGKPLSQFIDSSRELMTAFYNTCADRLRVFVAPNSHRASIGDWYVVERIGSGSGRTAVYPVITLYRRLLRGKDPNHDPTTEQSLAIFRPHERDPAVNCEFRTSEIDLAMSMFKIGRPRMVGAGRRDAVSVNIDSDNFAEGVDFFVHICEGNLFTSYQREARDRELLGDRSRRNRWTS